MNHKIFGKPALFGLLGALTVLTVVPVAVIVPAYAVDNIEGDDAPDLTGIKAKIEAKNYTGALADLRDLAQDTQQADFYNLLGFTLRKTGDYETALTYYNKALELKPDHKAAREYLGELYVATGDMAKAREQLASLTQLCPAGCEERADLQKAIDTKVTK
ncbi:tetratricopeptide repeat protein [Mesorhizobium sp. M0166]|uniref:tetratricopeptide repeat protein n=1 Tax=unclassified Mesorhizobium TaxID=325217 RepID=UPI0033370504